MKAELKLVLRNKLYLMPVSVVNKKALTEVRVNFNSLMFDQYKSS